LKTDRASLRGAVGRLDCGPLPVGGVHGDWPNRHLDSHSSSFACTPIHWPASLPSSGNRGPLLWLAPGFSNDCAETLFWAGVVFLLGVGARLGLFGRGGPAGALVFRHNSQGAGTRFHSVGWHLRSLMDAELQTGQSLVWLLWSTGNFGWRLRGFGGAAWRQRGGDADSNGNRYTRLRGVDSRRLETTPTTVSPWDLACPQDLRHVSHGTKTGPVRSQWHWDVRMGNSFELLLDKLSLPDLHSVGFRITVQRVSGGRVFSWLVRKNRPWRGRDRTGCGPRGVEDSLIPRQPGGKAVA